MKKAVTASELAAKNLATALKQIQSAAKQKHRMLAEDSDPATHFFPDGYPIGRRFEASRVLLLQSADALIARAQTDSLPGFRPPESIATLETLLEKYRSTEDKQQDATLGKENSRISRDALIESINHRRAAIQHAADAAWPPSEETNRPTRKTFSLPSTAPWDFEASTVSKQPHPIPPGPAVIFPAIESLPLPLKIG